MNGNVSKIRAEYMTSGNSKYDGMMVNVVVNTTTDEDMKNNTF